MSDKLNDIQTLATLQGQKGQPIWRTRREQDTFSSQIPFEEIPNGKEMSDIVRTWMAQSMETQSRLRYLQSMPTPRSVYTWGAPDVNYNIRGQFAHDAPEMIGIQRKTLNDLVYSNATPDPMRHHVLAHELAHFHDNLIPPLSFTTPSQQLWCGLSSPEKFAEQSKRKDVFYDNEAPVDERVADVIGTLARAMMEAKQEDDYRYANAPLAKPR